MAELITSINTFTPDALIGGTEIPLLSKVVTLIQGSGTVARGTVLGKITKAVGTPTYVGNTGNGTVGSITMGALTEIGNYVLTCTSKGSAAAAGTSAAFAGNTGDGTITASPATGSGCKVGIYKVICIEPTTNLGKFSVEDPDGITIGIATVGTEFSTHLTFTIADGGTDFVAGDGFNITVAAAANGGIFSVKTPSGILLAASATVGVAYTSGHLNFTIADGSTDFVVGDAITVPIAAGSGKYKIVNSANVDGSAVPDCVLIQTTVVASDADSAVEVYTQGLFNGDHLTFGGSDTVDTHREALRDKNIILTNEQ